MINFVSKTRGGVSPKDKPKVCLAFHPDDANYIEEICADILDIQDCAIYHIDNVDVEIVEAELIKSVSQMQLFVFIVSSNFLKDDCRAFNIEYQYAVKNNIPILPILIDGGAKRKFNEKCGSLQILSKYRDKKIEPQYKKNLASFLKTILIQDETIKEIKNIFKNRVFLSYRRKDKDYALKVMKHFHADGDLSKVAIWYDEFLTPGENYNNEIDENLKNCDAVIFVVTPSIVEQDNYIIRIEYPNATGYKKIILPIEIVDTPESELNKQYNHFPMCIKDDDQEFHKKIKSKLSLNIWSEQEENNLYTLALAYLYGICVEFDPIRATSILDHAIARGDLRAMFKLAELYHKGMYISKNYEKTLEIYKKIKNRYLGVYTRQGNKFLTSYIASSINIAILQMEMGLFKDAETELVDILNFSLSKLPTAPEIHKLLIKITNHLLAVYTETKNEEKYLETNAKLTEILALNNDEDLYEIANILNVQGVNYINHGDYKQAETVFRSAIEKQEKAVQLDPTEDKKLSLAVFYNNIAAANTGINNYNATIEYCEKALEIYQNLSNESYGNYDDRIATTNSIKGECYIKLNNIPKAIECLNKAIALYEKQLSIAPLSTCVSLIITYCNLVTVCDKHLIIEYGNKAISHFNQLTPDLQLQNECNIAKIYKVMGEAYNDQGKFEDSLKYHKLTLQVYNNQLNYNFTPKEDLMCSIIMSYKNIVLSFIKAKQYNFAETYYQDGLKVYDKCLKDEQLKNNFWIKVEANLLNDVHAQNLKHQQKYQDALKVVQENHKNYLLLNEISNNNYVKFKIDLIKNVYIEGYIDIYELIYDYENALKYCNEALTICEEVKKLNEELISNQYISIVSRIGNLYKITHQNDLAIKTYENLFNALTTTNMPGVNKAKEIKNCCIKLIDLLENSNDSDKLKFYNRELLIKMNEENETLIQDSPHYVNRLNVFQAISQDKGNSASIQEKLNMLAYYENNKGLDVYFGRINIAIAKMYDNTKKYKNAIKYYEKGIQEYRKKFGDDLKNFTINDYFTFDVINYYVALEKLAALQAKFKNLDIAIDLYKELLNVFNVDNLRGLAFLNYAKVVKNLSQIFLKTGKLDELIDLNIKFATLLGDKKYFNVEKDIEFCRQMLYLKKKENSQEVNKCTPYIIKLENRLYEEFSEHKKV